MEKRLCGILVATQLMAPWFAVAQTNTHLATAPQHLAIQANARPVGTVSTSPGNPAIEISARSLDFATVALGRTGTLSFTVQNPGRSTITGEAKVSAPFSIVGGSPYVLGSMQSQVITVQYTPNSTGMNVTVMRLTGGGGATITVSGIAFPARHAAPAFPRNLRLLAVR
jgi:hypothetical protein